MKRLSDDLSLIPSAVEEMLRYESPSQHMARRAFRHQPGFGRQTDSQRQAVIAVMAAANRIPNDSRILISSTSKSPANRRLAFEYAAHFCFGLPKARAEGQIAFEVMLRRLKNIRLA